MPNTSSYSIDGKEIRRNRACYADFLNPYQGQMVQDKAFILIEKEKQKYFGAEKIRQYLRDLKSMGFEFTFRTINGDIRVYPTRKIKKDAYNLMLCAAIRYLWEGKYGQTVSDHFYKFVDKYFEIKGQHGLTKLESLCMAHNLVKIEENGWMGFSCNHMWCKYGRHWVRLLKKPPTTAGNMNNYCSTTTKPKEIELWH